MVLTSGSKRTTRRIKMMAGVWERRRRTFAIVYYLGNLPMESETLDRGSTRFFKSAVLQVRQEQQQHGRAKCSHSELRSGTLVARVDLFCVAKRLTNVLLRSRSLSVSQAHIGGCCRLLTLRAKTYSGHIGREYASVLARGSLQSSMTFACKRKPRSVSADRGIGFSPTRSGTQFDVFRISNHGRKSRLSQPVRSTPSRDKLLSSCDRLTVDLTVARIDSCR